MSCKSCFTTTLSRVYHSMIIVTSELCFLKAVSVILVFVQGHRGARKQKVKGMFLGKFQSPHRQFDVILRPFG